MIDNDAMYFGKASSLHCTALFALICAAAPALFGQAPQSTSLNPQDELFATFRNPPNSARPRVSWHWMNGNISEEGIKLDLEWMHRIGLGGVTIFPADLSTPQVVPTPIIYMSPEWKQAFAYAVKTAKDLGLEVVTASSPGGGEDAGLAVVGENADPPGQADFATSGVGGSDRESGSKDASLADLRSTASAAHIQGQNIAAACLP